MLLIKSEKSKRVACFLLSVLLVVLIVLSPINQSKAYAAAVAVPVVIAGVAGLYLAASAVLVGLGFIKTDDTAWARLVDMVWYNEHLMNFKSGVVSWVEDGIQYIDEQFIKSVAMAANEITQYNPATFAPDTIMDIPNLGRFPVIDITGVDSVSKADLLYSKLDSVSFDMLNIRNGDSFNLSDDISFTITDYYIDDSNSSDKHRRFGYIVDYSKGGSLNAYATYDDSKYIVSFPVKHAGTTVTYYTVYNLSSICIFLEPHWLYDRNATGRDAYKFQFGTYIKFNKSGRSLSYNPWHQYYYNPSVNVFGTHTYADIVNKKWLDTPLDKPFGLTKDLPNHNIDEYGKAYVVPPLSWGKNPAKELAPSIDYPAIKKGQPIVIPDTKAGIGAIPQDKVQSGVKPDVANPDVSKPTDNVISKDKIDNMRKDLNLTDFFPFCIPFDLYKGLMLLTAPSVIPRWNMVIDIGYLEPWTVTIDLTSYEKLFIICRWFLTVIFCLGLATATHKYIKW